jgi:aspartate/methionine/tyrosine aminotransferase
VVGEWIAQHPGTISLGQGIVHFPAPSEVHQAVAAAATNEPSVDRYALVRGIDDLLTQIEQKVGEENGIVSSQQTCVVTAGSNMGFLNAVLAVADVEDEIILLSPYYFNHEMAIEIAGCRPVIVPTDADCQIDLPPIEAAITPRTRAIVTVSPNNPTGAVYSSDALTAVNQLCKKQDIYHITDEAYEYFVYGGRQHFSPASLAGSHRHTISLYTLSKAYGMAGWRCGYMVIPRQLEVAVKKIQDTNLVCPPIISQIAAAAAMKMGPAWCADRIANFDQVRDLVLHELADLGDRCRVPKPNGAFYALVQLETDKGDLEIVKSLIQDFGVAVMPGSTFGVSEGCSLRIAYGALAARTVAEGMGRLTRGLAALL